MLKVGQISCEVSEGLLCKMLYVVIELVLIESVKRFDFETAAFTARKKSLLLKQPQSTLITELEEGKVRLFRGLLRRNCPEGKGEKRSHMGTLFKETVDLSYQSC